MIPYYFIIHIGNSLPYMSMVINEIEIAVIVTAEK